MFKVIFIVCVFISVVEARHLENTKSDADSVKIPLDSSDTTLVRAVPNGNQEGAVENVKDLSATGTTGATDKADQTEVADADGTGQVEIYHGVTSHDGADNHGTDNNGVVVDDGHDDADNNEDEKKEEEDFYYDDVNGKIDYDYYAYEDYHFEHRQGNSNTEAHVTSNSNSGNVETTAKRIETTTTTTTTTTEPTTTTTESTTTTTEPTTTTTEPTTTTTTTMKTTTLTTTDPPNEEDVDPLGIFVENIKFQRFPTAMKMADFKEKVLGKRYKKLYILEETRDKKLFSMVRQLESVYTMKNDSLYVSFLFRFIFSRRCTEIDEYRLGDKSGDGQLATFEKKTKDDETERLFFFSDYPSEYVYLMSCTDAKTSPYACRDKYYVTLESSEDPPNSFKWLEASQELKQKMNLTFDDPRFMFNFVMTPCVWKGDK